MSTTTIPPVRFRTIGGVRIRYGCRNRGRPVSGRPRIRLPTSHLISDAGHFVWEKEPAQYALAVLDAITGSWP